jgi:uncharacterized phiE125 gp8 family phage protein
VDAVITQTTWPNGLITPELHTSTHVITPPSIEPVDLDEVKKHLRFTPISEDTLIDTYIAMARTHFEEYTGRTCLDTLLEHRIEGFGPSVIELPFPPLIEVVSVTYADGDGVDQVLADTAYVVDTPTGPYARRGTVRPTVATSWPTPLSDLGSVRIRYRAGYGTQPGDVPELIRGCLFFLVGHFHQHRAEVVDQAKGSLSTLPIGAETIMRAFKYSALPTRATLRRVTV